MNKRMHAVGRLVLLCLWAGRTAEAGAPTGVTGNWLWEDGRSAVLIYPCGDDLCGRLSWFKQSASAIQTDSHNPEPAERGRGVCGLQIISGLRPSGSSGGQGGRIHVLDSGSTYDVKVRLIDAVPPFLHVLSAKLLICLTAFLPGAARQRIV